jgi:hypothetical protein
VGSQAFGGLHRRLQEKTAESRWLETTGQAPFGRAKAAYWKSKLDAQADNGEEREHEQQTDAGKDELETAFHHLCRANALEVHRERYRKSNRRITIHKHI